jgi:hypothetical protein
MNKDIFVIEVYDTNDNLIGTFKNAQTAKITGPVTITDEGFIRHGKVTLKCVAQNATKGEPLPEMVESIIQKKGKEKKAKE